MYILKRILCCILIIPASILTLFEYIFVKKLPKEPLVNRLVDWGFDLNKQENI